MAFLKPRKKGFITHKSKPLLSTYLAEILHALGFSPWWNRKMRGRAMHRGEKQMQLAVVHLLPSLIHQLATNQVSPEEHLHSFIACSKLVIQLKV